jgi:hypothetical protein
MLKTFRVNDVCEFPNAELYWQAFEYAKSKGVPVFRPLKEDFGTYHCIGLHPDSELCGYVDASSYNEITIPEFFQFCDNWKECGSKPSEGEYIRYGAKVKVRDDENREWRTGYRYLAKLNDRFYQHIVLDGSDYNLFRFCELDETPEQTERQKQIAELETKMEELHEQIKKLKDADAN